MEFGPIQIRVLGSLIEKEITTPELYPLSLNALVNACNQRSSRDPILELADDEVRQALHSLEDLDLITTAHDSRVPKYEHRIRTVLNLRRDETAVLCVLMLRGPQTPGELRGRTERLYAFDDISSVQSTLDRLASRDVSTNSAVDTGPVVTVLPRQPGSRESRYAHLLSGTPEAIFPQVNRPGVPASEALQIDRIAHLESQLANLAESLAALQERVANLESGRGSTPASVDPL